MIYARNPCMFEQLPAFRAQLQPLSMCSRAASNSGSTQLQITTTQTAEGALVTLKKPLEQPSQYSSALQERVAAIQAKYAAAPAYSLVSDVFGNQYYVDNTARVQAQMQEELQAIDMAPVGRRLAKQSFRDYALELSHDGLELTVSSLSDGEQRALRFGSALSDFYVKACTVEDGRVAVLQIGVVLEKSAEKQDSLSALIDWAQQSAGNAVQEEQCPAIASCAAVNQQKKVQKRARAERAKHIEAEKAKRIEAEKAQRLEMERAQRIQQAKIERAQRIEAERAQRIQQAKIERAAAERLAAERLATQRAEHDRAMSARRNAELKRQRDIAETQAIEEQRARIQAMVAEQQARVQEQARLQAQAQAQAQEQQRQRTLQEQAAYQRQLVAEERALKQKRAMKEQHPTSAATTVTPPASPSPTRIAASPVVLEDVDDEETTRYNASVRRSSSPSRGYTPVVDDA
ncbi:Btn2 protein [Maudiozyma humilis]|uniref:Btn2 protein n=1 Tax=Maudiozyma humilis TaxID=51915 RepID=A0AAV5RRM6_MAUHU|nr:Btn2 protein [Kazachstania humilis]